VIPLVFAASNLLFYCYLTFQLVVGYRLLNGIRHRTELELDPRKIDGYWGEGYASVMPVPDIAAGLTYRPISDWANQLALHCQGEELIQRNKTSVKTKPNSQLLAPYYHAE